MIGLEQIASKCTDVAFNLALSHLGYVFGYSKNIQKLEAETEILEDEWRRIDGMVERAKQNADIVEPTVEKWQTSVKKLKEEVDKFLADKQKENMRCFKCWCPNIWWRYQLGKESKSMTDSVIELKDEGTKLMSLPVAHPPPPPELSAAHKHFDSRKQIFEGIMEALKDPRVKLIGVHGAGGVGKTTMVQEAGKQAKGEMLFDDVAMAIVSRTLNKKNVQGELASYLGLYLDREENENLRKNRLWRRLNNDKKNLVILDDVWEPLNLADIGIPITDGKNGCKVVVTSRRQDVFRKIMQNSVDQEDARVLKDFQIEVLTKLEAWTLFMKKAEISVNSEMPPEAKELCRKCGGLPVAILAVATALRGKEKHSWKDALEQLKNSKLDDIVDIDPNLFSSLRLSYDYLNPKDAQSCFLLCSLFPEDAKISIDDLVRYSFGMRLLCENLDTLEKVRNRVLTLVEKLQEYYLLLDGGDKNVVSMHDVVRDVAISIAKKEKGYLVNHNVKKWPERGNYESYLAISLRSEYFHELPNELECKQLHTLVLKCNKCLLTPVPNNFLKGIENSLEVLDLSEMPIESPPPSIAMLVKLRMLSLNGLTRDMALLGRLKSLKILSLHGITELAPEISHLTSLQLLDLSNCHKLGVIMPNVISNLRNLEELYISNYFDQWDVEATNQERRNASLFELNSLTHLTTLQVHIPKTSMTLPIEQCFSKLIRFRILISSFDGEKDIFTKQFEASNYEDHSSTRILILSNITLEDKFKVLMNKAEVLYLNKLEGLKEVFHDRDGMVFFELKYLEVSQCNNVEHIFGRLKMFQPTPRQISLGSFGKLSSLRVYDCKLKYLFSLSAARCLVKLQELRLESCVAIEEIVRKERQGDDGALIFPKLEEMVLYDLPNLRSFCSSMKETSIKDADNCNPAPFFSGMVAFPVLKKLRINGINIVSEVWDKKVEHLVLPEVEESFSQLMILEVAQCDKLVNLIPSHMMSRLQNLLILIVDGCEELKTIVESIRGGEGANDKPLIFSKLEQLRLLHLPSLDSFCCGDDLEESLFNQMVVFPSLWDLSLWYMPKMKAVWNNTPPTNSFNNLTSLEVVMCGGLSYVAPSEVLGNLSMLQKLGVYSCDSLEEVFRSSRGSNDGEGIVPAYAASGGVDDVNNVILPHLTSMRLSILPRLRSFCSGTRLPSTVEERLIERCPLLFKQFMLDASNASDSKDEDEETPKKEMAY